MLKDYRIDTDYIEFTLSFQGKIMNNLNTVKSLKELRNFLVNLKSLPANERAEMENGIDFTSLHIFADEMNVSEGVFSYDEQSYLIQSNDHDGWSIIPKEDFVE